MKNVKLLIKKIVPLFLLLLLCSVDAYAQSGITVRGTVVDKSNEAIIGASVIVKGRPTMGTITDVDGKFTLKVPSSSSTIVVTYVGMESKEVRVGSTRQFKITLEENNAQLNEVVVVGYGQQKKASVVGAITQTNGEVLQRAGGITDIGAALTGNLPGVITSASSGMPGDEEPQIIIRSASSWNSSEPLVLVDGIERPMGSVDISSVKTISVLKDASATAVYGVKGANGVILITTKRGQEGKAQISVSANAVMKIPSKLPDKLDSYDGMIYRNMAIEHELNLAPDNFAKYMKPMSFIENYRNQAGKVDEFGNLYSERYPNVDWQDALFKDYTMSYNANINVAGGTKFVKYYAAVDFVNEGDLYREFPSGRNYNTGYAYDCVNFRSTLDFNITKTTVFKVNLSGSNATRKSPWSNSVNSDWQISQQWSGVYNIGPDVFVPLYADGSWGYLPHGTNVTNSAQNIATGGQQTVTTTRLNTDFVLEQKLDFITKGLNLRGMISWDNVFVEKDRGINDLYNYAVGNKWTIKGGEVDNWKTQRNLNYQLQLNWARQFGKHNVTAMGLWGRQEYATGSMIPSYREDWVFRATYDWNTRYFVEYNGAYNGSEKFSSDNRFAFFQSGAIGWMVSDEPFMKWFRDNKIIDMLKIRASYGEIGDDNVGERFLYQTQWAMGGGKNGASYLDVNQGKSPYTWYRESIVGNTDIHWEQVKKTNIGIDYGILGGRIAGNIEFFHDKRVDILVNGNERAVPSYYGAKPAWVNKGEVKTKGYEIELRFNKTFANKLHLWGY